MMITIGLPFYNCQATLAKSIRSVFAQTHSDWQLILMDDGSSDASGQIAHAVRDARVAVVSDGVNRGLAARLNQISEMAQGTYLARMDGDDIMHPERLKRQLLLLESQPDLDVVGSAAYVINSEDVPSGKRGLGGCNVAPAAVVARGLFLHSTVVGRRHWFVRNPYDPRYLRAEDHELWCRTLGTSRFACVDEPLLFYREPDRFQLRNYVLGCRESRQIIQVYGPPVMGGIATIRLMAESLAREAAYRMAHGLGQAPRLVRRRSLPLTEGETESAVSILARIRATHVPGLDTTGRSHMDAASSPGDVQATFAT
jgi:glycosyltransferase involved in cell wall biosynthesis